MSKIFILIIGASSDIGLNLIKNISDEAFDYSSL
jgi:short-subunit dehydrogenase